jgi:hypothetical protein
MKPAVLRGVAGTSLVGLYGKPFLVLDDALAELGITTAHILSLHREMATAYASLPVDYTGGSHRSMAIMPPSRSADAHIDYGEALAALNDQQWLDFVALADDPSDYDDVSRTDVGEERQAPLSRRQMWWLKVHCGVYFPWQGYLELMPNRHWADKSDGQGKQFTRLAKQHLPRTLELVARLPFTHIGRCNVMGLDAHHHGTLHRDGHPHEQEAADEFITLYPSPLRKRLYLWDEPAQHSVEVQGGAAIWFNDFDYHGVHADPHFRYSMRIDGVFTDAFRRRLAQ